MPRELDLLAGDISSKRRCRSDLVGNAILVVAVFAGLSCPNTRAMNVDPLHPRAIASPVLRPIETGTASIYSDDLDGRRTASGERYDKSGATAAHRSLPFGSQVRVTNVRNNKSVTVRINDRGPHVAGRILDLSRNAAERLGARAGVLKVRIEVVDVPKH